MSNGIYHILKNIISNWIAVKTIQQNLLILPIALMLKKQQVKKQWDLVNLNQGQNKLHEKANLFILYYCNNLLYYHVTTLYVLCS